MKTTLRLSLIFALLWLLFTLLLMLLLTIVGLTYSGIAVPIVSGLISAFLTAYSIEE